MVCVFEGALGRWLTWPHCSQFVHQRGWVNNQPFSITSDVNFHMILSLLSCYIIDFQLFIYIFARLNTMLMILAHFEAVGETPGPVSLTWTFPKRRQSRRQSRRSQAAKKFLDEGMDCYRCIMLYCKIVHSDYVMVVICCNRIYIYIH